MLIRLLPIFFCIQPLAAIANDGFTLRAAESLNSKGISEQRMQPQILAQQGNLQSQQYDLQLLQLLEMMNKQAKEEQDRADRADRAFQQRQQQFDQQRANEEYQEYLNKSLELQRQQQLLRSISPPTTTTDCYRNPFGGITCTTQ
jgi:Skp family chaperone for outer membrane proteins